MKAFTHDWLAKAKADLGTAEREYLAVPPNYDAVAFHCQQSAEKYLKAYLVEADVGFPKTHDLPALLDLICPIQPNWLLLRSDLNSLTSLGIEVRYPGMTADHEDAGEALRIARDVQALVAGALKS